MRRHRLTYGTNRQDAARILAELRTHDARTTPELAHAAGLSYDRSYRALLDLTRHRLVLDRRPPHPTEDEPALLWHLTDLGARARPPLHDLDPNLDDA